MIIVHDHRPSSSIHHHPSIIIHPSSSIRPSSSSIHPIPSHPIPPHPIPSHPVPSHPIPSHPIPSIHPSIHHSIIPSFHHSIIPSFHHSIIPSFHHLLILEDLPDVPLEVNVELLLEILSELRVVVKAGPGGSGWCPWGQSGCHGARMPSLAQMSLLLCMACTWANDLSSELISWCCQRFVETMFYGLLDWLKPLTSRPRSELCLGTTQWAFTGQVAFHVAGAMVPWHGVAGVADSRRFQEGYNAQLRLNLLCRISKVCH